MQDFENLIKQYQDLKRIKEEKLKKLEEEYEPKIKEVSEKANALFAKIMKKSGLLASMKFALHYTHFPEMLHSRMGEVRDVYLESIHPRNADDIIYDFFKANLPTLECNWMRGSLDLGECQLYYNDNVGLNLNRFKDLDSCLKFCSQCNITISMKEVRSTIKNLKERIEESRKEVVFHENVMKKFSQFIDPLEIRITRG